jgi:hypothetical protein
MIVCEHKCGVFLTIYFWSKLMPAFGGQITHRNIRSATISQVVVLRDLKRQKSRSDFEKAIKLDAVVKLALELMNDFSSPNPEADDSLGRLRQLPSFEYFVKQAHRKLELQLKNLTQLQNSQLSRRPTYPIGPLISHDLGRRHGIVEHRLPRTFRGFIEDTIREELRTTKKSMKAVWCILCQKLKTFDESVAPREDIGSLREDRYVVHIGGNSEYLSFGQFEKLFRQARLAQKVLG